MLSTSMSNVIILSKQELYFDVRGGELVCFDLHHEASGVNLSLLDSQITQHVVMGWGRLIQGLADSLESRSLL